jgi:GNAT superfamily N-acetyltransferase
VIFKESDGADADFALLCGDLDKALDELVGRAFQRNVYAQYNLRDAIHNVVLAYDQTTPVACGSYKRYDAESAELKRIYVAPAYRAHGLGAQIVKRLEEKAQKQGYKRCILETGAPLKAACHLYQKLGYRVIPNYGQYANMAASICMCKEL